MSSMETILMKCQILFSVESMKNMTKLSYAVLDPENGKR